MGGDHGAFRQALHDHLVVLKDALKTMMLLSALESWSFSAKIDLPDYLHEDLSIALEKLEKIVLEKA